MCVMCVVFIAAGAELCYMFTRAFICFHSLFDFLLLNRHSRSKKKQNKIKQFSSLLAGVCNGGEEENKIFYGIHRFECFCLIVTIYFDFNLSSFGRIYETCSSSLYLDNFLARFRWYNYETRYQTEFPFSIHMRLHEIRDRIWCVCHSLLRWK